MHKSISRVTAKVSRFYSHTYLTLVTPCVQSALPVPMAVQKAMIAINIVEENAMVVMLLFSLVSSRELAHKQVSILLYT